MLVPSLEAVVSIPPELDNSSKGVGSIRVLASPLRLDWELRVLDSNRHSLQNLVHDLLNIRQTSSEH